MKTDGIIFDVDGTLWDATEQITEAYTVILQQEHIEHKVITAEILSSVMGLMNEDIAARLFPELSYEKRMHLIERCCAFECDYLRKHGGRLYPQALEVLKKLSARYPLYIVSNCQDGYIEAMFDVHGLQTYFRDYECSGRTGKPKYENLNMIKERNHLQQPVYIGDTKTDQISCEKAGIPFVYAAFGFGEATAYAARVNSFAELEQLFLSDESTYIQKQ